MDTVTITLSLPEPRLGPNHTVAGMQGRMAKARATKRYRDAAWITTVGRMPGNGTPWEKARATLTFYVPDLRRRDIRNMEAAMKPAYDGIVDAGLIVDDDWKHLAHGETKPVEVDRDNPRVEIMVERVCDD